MRIEPRSAIVCASTSRICGTGSCSTRAAEWGGTCESRRSRGPRLVVGLDLSLAVVAARELTASLPGVAVVRGDLLKLPFAAGTFDHIYSLGVIDHTPDPRAVFLGLTRLLKPGGRIAIWVYPRQRAIVEAIMNQSARGLDSFAREVSRSPVPTLKPRGHFEARLMSSRWRPSNDWAWRSIWRRSASRCTPIRRSAFAIRLTGMHQISLCAMVSTRCAAGLRRPAWSTSST